MSTTDIYTLSLHDALPIFQRTCKVTKLMVAQIEEVILPTAKFRIQLMNIYGARELTVLLCKDRKSTRLNSSHVAISYAVFCLKKKKKITKIKIMTYTVITS